MACAWVGFRAHGCDARCVLVRSFGVEGEAHSEARKRRRRRTPLSFSPPPSTPPSTSLPLSGAERVPVPCTEGRREGGAARGSPAGKEGRRGEGRGERRDEGEGWDVDRRGRKVPEPVGREGRRCDASRGGNTVPQPTGRMFTEWTGPVEEFLLGPGGDRSTWTRDPRGTVPIPRPSGGTTLPASNIRRRRVPLWTGGPARSSTEEPRGSQQASPVERKSRL